MKILKSIAFFLFFNILSIGISYSSSRRLSKPASLSSILDTDDSAGYSDTELTSDTEEIFSIQKYFNENSQQYGNKTANLQLLESFANKINNQLEGGNVIVSVPSFYPFSHKYIWNFLNKNNELSRFWDNFKEEQKDNKKSLTLSSTKVLEQIRTFITEKFTADESTIDSFFQKDTDFNNFLSKIEKEKSLLMVRSTGKEDTNELANAGGNESLASVKPTKEAVFNAIGIVIASYFSSKSLTQRLIANDNILADPFVPVLIQKMIGEPLNGTDNIKEIPRSGVMFTTEAEGKTPGVTQIQATWGHNEAVVNSLVPVDTYYIGNIPYVINSQNFFNVHSIIRKKDRRLVPVNNGLDFKKNLNHMEIQSCLSVKVIEALKVTANVIENYYTNKLESGKLSPMDVEFVVISENSMDKIYLVQARPIVFPEDKIPNYLKESFVLENKNKIYFDIIGSGGGAVVKIDSPYKIIIKDSLPQALDVYLDMNKKRESIKLILVSQMAPSTSHEATAFRSEGIPVIVFNDLSHIREWINNTNIKNPILFDIQRCLAIKIDSSLGNFHFDDSSLSDSGSYEDDYLAGDSFLSNSDSGSYEDDSFLSNGWFKSPIPMETSLPPSEVDTKKISLERKHIGNSIVKTSRGHNTSRSNASETSKYNSPQISTDVNIGEFLRTESIRPGTSIRRHRDRIESMITPRIENGSKDLEDINKIKDIYLKYFTDLLNSLNLNLSSLKDSTIPAFNKKEIKKLFENIKNNENSYEKLSSLRQLIQIILQELKFNKLISEDFGSISLYILDKKEINKFIYYLLTYANEVQAIIRKNTENESSKRLEILYAVNFLEAIIFQKENEKILYSYSLEEIINELQKYRVGIETLSNLSGSASSDENIQNPKEYMKQLFGDNMDKDKLRNLIELYSLGKYSINNKIYKKWLNFIIAISKLIEWPTKFFENITVLSKFKTFSTWLNSAFNDNWDGSTNSIESFIESFNREFLGAATIIMFLDESQSILDTWENKINDWSNPQEKHFNKLLDSFNNQFVVKFLNLASYFNKSRNNFVKILILDLFSKVIDIYDKSIKELTGSSEYLELDLKAKRFKELLKPYLALMFQWLDIIPEENWDELATVSRDIYKKRIIEIYDKIKNVKESTLKGSSGFSVDAAMIGSKADFNQHLPKTLEDLFTLAHQNMLVTLAFFYKAFGFNLNILPEFPKAIFDEILSLNDITFFGMEYKYPNIVAYFNIPLRQHSTRINMSFDIKEEKLVTVKCSYIGMNEANRMNLMLLFSILAAFRLDYELDPKPTRFFIPKILDTKGFDFSLKISSSSDWKNLANLIKTLGSLSFTGNVPYYYLSSLELLDFIFPLNLDQYIEDNWERIINYTVFFSDYLIEYFLQKNECKNRINPEIREKLNIIIEKTRENIELHELSNSELRFFPSFINSYLDRSKHLSLQALNPSGQKEGINSYLNRIDEFLNKTDESDKFLNELFNIKKYNIEDPNIDLILLLNKQIHKKSVSIFVNKNSEKFLSFIPRHFPELLKKNQLLSIINSNENRDDQAVEYAYSFWAILRYLKEIGPLSTSKLLKSQFFGDFVPDENLFIRNKLISHKDLLKLILEAKLKNLPDNNLIMAVRFLLGNLKQNEILPTFNTILEQLEEKINLNKNIDYYLKILTIFSSRFNDELLNNAVDIDMRPEYLYKYQMFNSSLTNTIITRIFYLKNYMSKIKFFNLIFNPIIKPIIERKLNSDNYKIKNIFLKKLHSIVQFCLKNLEETEAQEFLYNLAKLDNVELDNIFTIKVNNKISEYYHGIRKDLYRPKTYIESLILELRKKNLI